MKYEAIGTVEGYWRVWEGSILVCDCGKGAPARRNAEMLAHVMNNHTPLFRSLRELCTAADNGEKPEASALAYAKQVLNQAEWRA